MLLDECSACHGVFVDSEALERVLAERSQTRADAILGTADLPPVEELPRRHGGPMYIRCPDCDQMMSRRVFAKGAGVIIDACRHHGTWFDAHELGHVIQFAMNGGIERAALREAEQRRETERAARGAAMIKRTLERPAANLDYYDGDFLGSFVDGLGGDWS